MASAADVPTTAGRPRLTLAIRRVEGVPIVAARAWLTGGARLEAVPGLALVTGRMLTEGSRRRGWRRIAREAEDRGVALDSGAGFESLGAGVDALVARAGDVERALGWLAELVREPAFPAARLDWVRRRTAAELEMMDHPEARTALAFGRQLYGEHPYGRPLQGAAGSLERIDPEACAACHREALARGLLVVVTGAVDEDAVRRRLEALFGDLAADPSPAVPLPAVPPPAGDGPARRRLTFDDGDQAHIFAGHLTVPRAHPDRPALDLLAIVLGAAGGLGGRLWTRVREREGLAYEVSAATAAGAGLDPGRLAVYAATAPATAARAERAIRDELSRLVDGGIDEEELEDARGFLLGSWPFRFETARQWADRLAEAAFYDLPGDGLTWPLDIWRRLDRAAVNAVLRRHLRPADLRVTIGAPARQLG